MVALRIGFFAVRPPSDKEATTRNLAAWLSPRDCAELIRAAVEADVLGFVVANGTSANSFRHADLRDTCAELGYQPLDDARASPG